MPEWCAAPIEVHNGTRQAFKCRKVAPTGTSPAAGRVASRALTRNPVLPLDPTKYFRSSPSMRSRSPPAITASTERTFVSSQPYS